MFFVIIGFFFCKESSRSTWSALKPFLCAVIFIASGLENSLSMITGPRNSEISPIILLLLNGYVHVYYSQGQVYLLLWKEFLPPTPFLLLYNMNSKTAPTLKIWTAYQI